MSNYSTIIESLVRTRVNEGTLLRDYKGIINQLKKALLSKSTDVVPYDVNNAIAKYKTLDCIGGFSFDFSGHAEGDVIHNGHRVLRYQVL